MKPRKIVIVDEMATHGTVRVEGRRHECEIRSIPAEDRVLWTLAAEHCEILVVESARVPSIVASWGDSFGGRVDHPLLILIRDRLTFAVTVNEVGVHDFVEKPFTFERLLHTIERALDHFDLRRENRELRARLEKPEAPSLALVESLVPDGLKVPANLEPFVRTFEAGSVREMERLMILERLLRHEQNRTRAAKSLEISVRTLRNKLREYRREGLLEEPALAVR